MTRFFRTLNGSIAQAILIAALIISMITAMAPSAFAAGASTERTDAIVSSNVEDRRIDEQVAELANEIDRQADEAFREFAATSGTRVPLTVFRRAEREAVYRLRQMNVLTDILKASGRSTAIAIIATEILTAGFAPFAVWIGKPAWSGIALTVPWGVIAGVGCFLVSDLEAALFTHPQTWTEITSWAR